MRVNKRTWYDIGGFANPRCYRKANSRGVWQYYVTPNPHSYH
jgi:hypothetical protein